jgi:arsenical pump membrane protein
VTAGLTLALVFAVASSVTVVLGLDPTIVLLTPVVLATATRLRISPEPDVYATVHLANSASLLLPVSNLTNLLAFTASGLSFTGFAALMLLPTVAAITVEWVVLNRFFAAELGRPPGHQAGQAAPHLPRLAVTVLGATLAGFLAGSLLGISPVWIAAAGAAAITVPALVRRRRRPARCCGPSSRRSCCSSSAWASSSPPPAATAWPSRSGWSCLAAPRCPPC